MSEAEGTVRTVGCLHLVYARDAFRFEICPLHSGRDRRRIRRLYLLNHSFGLCLFILLMELFSAPLVGAVRVVKAP